MDSSLIISNFSEFLYPLQGKPLEIRQIDGQYEMFTMIEKTIKARLAILINSAPKILAPTESLLAGSIAMAMCHINRVSIEGHELYFYLFVSLTNILPI